MEARLISIAQEAHAEARSATKTRGRKFTQPEPWVAPVITEELVARTIAEKGWWPSVHSFKRMAHDLAWYPWRKEARRLTEFTLRRRENQRLIPGIELRGRSFHVDHIVPLYKAFSLGWTPMQAAAVENLQMLSLAENHAKGDRGCWCSLEFREPWATYYGTYSAPAAQQMEMAA
jgi:hypothetical protein